MLYDNLSVPSITDNNAHKLIRTYLSRSDRYLNADSFDMLCLWKPNFFDLEKTNAYLSISSEKQHAILKQCALNLLLESYFIEKTGMIYSAKITSLAPTQEEKQMFCFIGADEATHLSWIDCFVPNEHKTMPSSSLLNLINDIISIDNVNLLYYLVQIILEGWGIKHYQHLSENCQHPQLKKVLKDIVKDEALHHHTGKTFFSARALSATDKRIILDSLKSYCDLVRLGPQAVALTLNMSHEDLTQTRQIKLFDELNHEKNTAEKLLALKQLMQQPGLETILDTLDKQGYFKPYSNEVCATILAQSSAEQSLPE